MLAYFLECIWLYLIVFTHFVLDLVVQYITNKSIKYIFKNRKGKTNFNSHITISTNLDNQTPPHLLFFLSISVDANDFFCFFLSLSIIIQIDWQNSCIEFIQLMNVWNPKLRQGWKPRVDHRASQAGLCLFYHLL